MTSIQIIGAIMMATGKPVPDVAKEHGYSKHTICRVINGERCIEDVRNIIATITSKPVSSLWPNDKKNTSVPAGRSTPSVGCLVGTEDPSRD